MVLVTQRNKEINFGQNLSESSDHPNQDVRAAGSKVCLCLSQGPPSCLQNGNVLVETNIVTALVEDK
jgi:hypothetical protein